MSNLILNIACSVQMSQVARTTLLKALSRNASIALAKPAEDLTLVLNCDSGMMIQGKFGPAALVCAAASHCQPRSRCPAHTQAQIKHPHSLQGHCAASTFMHVASIWVGCTISFQELLHLLGRVARGGTNEVSTIVSDNEPPLPRNAKTMHRRVRVTMTKRAFRSR